MFKQPGVEDLTYVIDDELLLITTQDRADATLKVKVYPVADLVLPVQNLGIVGGERGVLLPERRHLARSAATPVFKPSDNGIAENPAGKDQSPARRTG